MKKTLFQKVLCLILSVTTLLGVFAFSAFAAASEVQYGTNKDTASSLEDMESLVGVSTYEEYILENASNQIGGKRDIIKIDVVTPITALSNGKVVANSKDCQDSMAKNPENWENFGTDSENTLYLPSLGQTTWSFTVPDDAQGYYYIKIEYFTCDITSVIESANDPNKEGNKSSISSIERKLFIDGSAPFKEASYITLGKTWEFDYISVSDPVAVDEKDGTTVEYKFITIDEESNRQAWCKVVKTVKDGMMTETVYAISQDINQNSMLPVAEQIPSWNTYYCQDSSGYYQGFFQFYMHEGTHQLTLEAEREPMIIKSIELVPVGYDKDEELKAEISIPTYSEVLESYKNNGYKAPENGSISFIEAEFPDLVSDSAVYATNDKTSSATTPSRPNAQVYNVIGENSYNALGQWAAYKFTVSETGLYKFGMRYKQNALQGMFVCRAIKLAGGKYGLEDGTPKAPFAEAYNAQFDYNKDWQSEYIGYRNDAGERIDFEFYFEAGVEYTIYLECSLGALQDVIRDAEKSLNAINGYYLDILKLTGSVPDANRDYEFLKVIPYVLTGLKQEAKNLKRIKEDLESLCNDSGSHTATLQTIYLLLDKMGDRDGLDIAKNLGTLKSYLGTLGTWINDSKKGTLIVDSISVVPVNADKAVLPEAKAGFFSSLWFEIRSFFYSFFIDYDAMGLTEKPTKDSRSVDVWIAEGRDQSNIWRTMIDKDGGFTNTTGYGVTLKLVTAGTLLPSILAGKGPDVYMGLDASTVINYAIRGAVVGVNGEDHGKPAGDGKYEGGLNEYQNAVFKSYIYKTDAGEYIYLDAPTDNPGWKLVSSPYDVVAGANYSKAAIKTLNLLGVAYGVPQTMNFAMMFYRMDVLAELGCEVPETWDDLLVILPDLLSNNMQIGVSYILALDFMIYQQGGSMWKYEEDPQWAGARIDLDSPKSLRSFNFITRLFTDYSFPVSYDASNRFRTGEMPIIVGDYIGTYNTLTVYATEIDGLWEFCPLPGSTARDKDDNIIYKENGEPEINYNSLASVTAAVILNGAKKQKEIRADGTERYVDLEAAWAYLQWQTSADVQAEYGNKMVALIGPSAKYQAANLNAIQNLSWTAGEYTAIRNQMDHMSSIVNYPGSYIMARYMKFAFLEVVEDGTDSTEALSQYIKTMNDEIRRKREEFNLPILETNDPDPV